MEELSAVRQEGESFEAYKHRMKALNMAYKIYKKGMIVNFRTHLQMQEHAKANKGRDAISN